MDEFSLFLLKHWLPLGIAAILFFTIGLLLAKFIWGRFNHRLSFAVEENLNLASQWSALGASQRDLFKKLRARWQSDRDAWETQLAETETDLSAREARIEQLTEQLKSSGKAIPAPVVFDKGHERRIEELENRLKEKEEEIESLKLETEEKTTPGEFFAQAQPTSESVEDEPSPDLLQRIRELEQDLIDTHDELHQVRTEADKQAELVESLESQLIDNTSLQSELETNRDAVSTAETKQNNANRKGVQLSALASWKNQETLRFRSRLSELRSAESTSAGLRDTLAAKEETIEKLTAELSEAVEKQEEQAEEIAELSERIAAQGDEITSLSDQYDEATEQISSKESQLEKQQVEFTAQAEQQAQKILDLTASLESLKPIERKRTQLQAELNDACHEMYDVRSALNDRLDEIELLEARLDELDGAEEERERLDLELKETRRDFEKLRVRFDESQISLKTAGGQIEELEAIIEDRSAEVDDLSAEVRQQRDAIRNLKNHLAEREGETEALVAQNATLQEEASSSELSINNKVKRIADLEQALSERYEEMNSVRMEYDEELKSARYHAARADQLTAELDRRAAAFDESNVRAVTSEEALEEANLQISNLTEKLAESDSSIAELKVETQSLSQEKDLQIQEIEKAGARIEELEAAAKNREDELEAIGSELKQAHKDAAEEGESRQKEFESLTRKIDQLTAEVETAKQEQEKTEASLVEMEEALKASDDKTLKLSSKLDQKEQETAQLNEDLSELRAQLAELEKEVTAAEAKVTDTSEQLESKLEEVISDKDSIIAAKEGMLGEKNAEIEDLRRELQKQETALETYDDLRSQSVVDVEKLVEKLADRNDSIRELQSEISSIMMQRASRDSEISLLKEKLHAISERHQEIPSATKADSDEPSGSSEEALENAIQASLSVEQESDGGISLDEIDNDHGEAHHAPVASVQDVQEQTAKPVPDDQSDEAGDDEHIVFFDEASAELTESSVAKIDNFAHAMRKAGRSVSVSLIGFSGQEGSVDYTESLSARRAEAVRERLLERGVLQSSVSVSSSGQDRRFTNWRARRVELIQVAQPVAESIN